jgi:hypothetical protein
MKDKRMRIYNGQLEPFSLSPELKREIKKILKTDKYTEAIELHCALYLSGDRAREETPSPGELRKKLKKATARVKEIKTIFDELYSTPGMEYELMHLAENDCSDLLTERERLAFRAGTMHRIIDHISGLDKIASWASKQGAGRPPGTGDHSLTFLLKMLHYYCFEALGQFGRNTKAGVEGDPLSRLVRALMPELGENTDKKKEVLAELKNDPVKPYSNYDPFLDPGWVQKFKK